MSNVRTADQQRFVDALEDVDGVVVHLGYSGRFMFGATCPAAEADAAEDVYSALAEHGAGDLIKKCSRDSMGLGVVVYLRDGD